MYTKSGWGRLALRETGSRKETEWLYSLFRIRILHELHAHQNAENYYKHRGRDRSQVVKILVVTAVSHLDHIVKFVQDPTQKQDEMGSTSNSQLTYQQ